MWAARKKRFERLLALRQREVEQRQAEASRARNALRDTRLALEQAQAALRRAAGTWRVTPGEIRTADSFLEAGAWLQDKIKGVEGALGVHEQAKERVRLTQLEVQKAEKAKRQIEVLLERLKKEHAAALSAREQKEQDELATRLSVYRR